MDKVLLHAVKELHNLGYEFDIFVLRDATTPFISSTDIKKSIQLLKKRKVPIVCAVYEQHLNPYFNIVEINSKGFLELVKKPKVLPKSRQSAPTVYQMSGFHILNKLRFLKHKTWYMPKILPYEIPIETGLMIDTNYEFLIAKHMFKIFNVD
jgi:CMP-N-acetylneuraminic acid synthetase